VSFSLAIISDIHGNAAALDEVIADIRLENVEQALCLGDVVAFGPEPKRTLDAIRDLNCEVIIGNTDEWVIKPPSRKSAKGPSRMRAEQLRWCNSQLLPEDISYIESFKPTATVDLGEGKSLLAFHGSPKSANDVIISTTSVNEYDEMLADYKADIFVGGHTHLSMLRRHRESLIVNPGSVGLPVDRLALEETEQLLLPYAEYVIIHRDEETLSIEFRHVQLDIEAIIESVEESDFPHKERWMDGWKRLFEVEGL